MSAAITLAVDALEAAPAVVSGLTSIAGAVETDLATHKTIINTATDALSAASTSLQSAPVQAALGAKGDSVVEAGEATATAGLTIWEEVEALIAKLKAIF